MKQQTWWLFELTTVFCLLQCSQNNYQSTGVRDWHEGTGITLMSKASGVQLQLTTMRPSLHHARTFYSRTIWSLTSITNINTQNKLGVEGGEVQMTIESQYVDLLMVDYTLYGRRDLKVEYAADDLNYSGLISNFVVIKYTLC